MQDQIWYSCYLSNIKFKICILAFMAAFSLTAQDTIKVPAAKSSFDKKEEILYNNNRYRKYNNYLTFGAGALGSTIQKNVQRSFGVDYHFHAKNRYFVAGLAFSGEGISATNDIQVHACYEIREEKRWTNVTIFAGPSLFTGVTGTAPDTSKSSTTGTLSVPTSTTPPRFYGGVGAYFCFQAVFKIKYDLGFGFDIFADVGTKRQMGGFKLILFFSGAYRGTKQNYNPHVKSENRR